DAVVDTSAMSLSELRREILAKIEISEGPLSIIFTSFGFKYGIPADSDYVIDVRFLPNPFYEPSLRALSGKDNEVGEFIKSSGEIADFIEELFTFFDLVFNLYSNTGKNLVHIAVGCTGGRHRSVVVAEWLCSRFPGNSIVMHRDIEKETVLL
ncbi:MAG: RNase adapter RapZ, partial [Thermovirgaceae bacterium]|nr:RNase adapter RapZ [Thermovirgaceae bacterium]